MMEKQCPFDIAEQIRANYYEIMQNIADACASVGRNEREVTLLGVTKTVSSDIINVALDAGLTSVGENRAQEMLSKIDELHLGGKEMHFIGGLQTNKVKQIISRADMIQSVDRIKLARTISEEWHKICDDKKFGVLVEVNIGNEVSKDGVSPDALPELLYEISELGNLEIRGLMTIPPAFDSEIKQRECFSKMFKLFIDNRTKNIDNVNMDILSMGMSGDYTQAIKEGSTMVRVGTSLFGKR